MAKSGDVLRIPELGIEVRFTRTAAETGGELSEFVVSGRPRGLLNQEHAHTAQTERIEALSGSIEVAMGGRRRVLSAGEAIEIPPGTPHTQPPAGDGPGTVRIAVRPAIARAMEGLEPYARGTAPQVAPEAVLPDDAVPAA